MSKSEGKTLQVLLVVVGFAALLLVPLGVQYFRVKDYVYCNSYAVVDFKPGVSESDALIRNSSAVADFSYQKEYVYHESYLYDWDSGCKQLKDMGLYAKWQRLVEPLK